MKIAWYSTDWQSEPAPNGRMRSWFGGTFHYRMNLPARALEANGHGRVFARALVPDGTGWLRVLDMGGTWHDGCDTVVVQRWMAANGADLAGNAVAAGQTILQDVDDDFWALPASNIARDTTDPRLSEHNRNNYRQMIEASSAAICSTDAIADRVRGFGVDRVHVCRNMIDLDRWKQRDPAADGMVGWVGGIAWRARDLQQLRGVLGPFLEKHGLPFYHGGHDHDRRPWAWEQLSLDITKTKVALAPILPISHYPHLWAPVSVGLVPMEDCPFNRAKSWLKGLEACAKGIPFVASRLPEYELLGVGRLASKRGEWRAHLEELLDPKVRREEGARNRARAEEVSVDKQWHQWDAALTARVTV